MELILRWNIHLNPACRQEEEHVLGRACCANRKDTYRRTWMCLQGGFEQSLLQKVGIFDSIDSRTKEKDAGKEAGKRKQKEDTLNY